MWLWNPPVVFPSQDTALQMHHVFRAAGAIFLTTLTLQSQAVPNGGNPKHDDNSATELVAALVHVDISYDQVRQIIVTEQKTGYRPLPPGIAKNLARGKPLPRGIAKKKVPTTIVRHLPTYPDYEWRRCGADLLLVQIATQVIAEIFADVFE
jgi:hypothetical protein